MTQYYIILLRIIHIFGGMFWIGSVYVTVGFITPTAAALGADGGKFMAYVTRVKHFPQFITGAAMFNVGAGLLLYWERWRGINITTPWGLAVTIGAICAIAALVIAARVVVPGIDRIVTLGQQIASAGKPPSQEQVSAIGLLQRTVGRASIAVAVLLTITLLAMATGRYL